MRVISVNVGRPRPNPWKEMTLTGIDKQPVEGPVMVRPARAKGLGMVGLAGDKVFDVRNHGGPDMAVYAYAREDLDDWATQLGRPLSNGMFGENLTTEGADPNGALIGERWRIGADLILEVSSPRIPCGTFQGWLNQAGWIKRFTLAARPGAYFRVIESGQVQAGGPDRDRVPAGPRRHRQRVVPGVHHRTRPAAAVAHRRRAPPRAQGPGAAAYCVSASASMASAGWLASSQRTRGSRRNQDSWRRANRLVALIVSSRASSRVHSPSR